MIRAVVTDIEGTTSSLSFVKDVLFPYARKHLADYLASHAREPEIRAILKETATAAGIPLDDAAATSQLLRWLDEDRKVTPLKTLQGLIWEAGFRHGDFKGHVYPDVVPCLTAWSAAGLRLYVYSSGSVHAQKLLFGHSEYGDLTPLFTGYFDTRIGAKQDAAAYRAIAHETGLIPGEILFLSDIGAELDAARAAGFMTCQLLREGASASPHHPHAADFFAIRLPGLPG